MKNSKDTLTQFLMDMSALQPLRGENAQKAIVQTLGLISDQAEKDGLTEDDVTRLIHEARAN